MKDRDLPLLNQASNALFSSDLFEAYARKQLQHQIDFEAHRRVAELRKSCGVKTELSSINIRRPPRYG